nr:MAG TPA: hypothetical protein [Caudoviricetes sp.]
MGAFVGTDSCSRNSDIRQQPAGNICCCIHADSRCNCFPE